MTSRSLHAWVLLYWVGREGLDHLTHSQARRNLAGAAPSVIASVDDRV